jgi:tetratricopeptide (TPR) repeat protein
MAIRGIGRRGRRERWWETVALGLGLAGALLAGGVRPVRADGGGGGGGSEATSAKPRDPAYQDAVAAIEKGDPRRAIGLLQGVVQREPANADAWNWLAYATRQTGDASRALPLYEKALAIDPKHRGAHEYIGEAYLILGDLPKARQHLAHLDKLCFFPCSEYRDLKKAVEAYEKSGGQTRPTAGKTP